MPKLPQDALDKRFTCPQCRRTFRTRQGLSGHIQFSHERDKKPVQFGPEYVLAAIRRYEKMALADGVSQSEARHKSILLQEWMDVRLLFQMLDIEYNLQDLKNYIVTSMAVANQQRKLMEQLVSAQKELLSNFVINSSQ